MEHGTIIIGAGLSGILMSKTQINKSPMSILKIL